MYAGLAPHDALAVYAVISYLDSVAGVYFPRGGIHAVARALAGAAEKHGVRIRYGTTVDPGGDLRAAGRPGWSPPTASGCRPTWCVLNPDLPVAYRDLLPPAPPRRAGCGTRPPAWCCTSGPARATGGIAHHNIHFGRAWRAHLRRGDPPGRLMTDPSLLVTNPSRTDPSVAPAGRHTYYVLAPVPNLDRAARSTGGAAWPGGTPTS